MVVNAELMQWAACNLVGKGYLLYASDDQFPKTGMCSPGIPFWKAQFTLPLPNKKSASDISAPEEHTQTINSDEIPEKNCCLVTRERKLAMDIITYVGDMGGARVKAHMVRHLYGTQVAIWGRQSIFCIHSCTHSCLKFLSQPTPSNNHVLSALLFTVRRKPSGNWVISIFSGQKPCTRIV